MTPAEEAGWKVGDRGVVVAEQGEIINNLTIQVERGTEVVFDEDRGEIYPRFLCPEYECKQFIPLSAVMRHEDGQDPINSPPHYTQGGIECIDAIRAALTEEEFRGYCKAAAIKYIWRERHKGGDESLGKALWYLREVRGENER